MLFELNRFPPPLILKSRCHPCTLKPILLGGKDESCFTCRTCFRNLHPKSHIALYCIVILLVISTTLIELLRPGYGQGSWDEVAVRLHEFGFRLRL